VYTITKAFSFSASHTLTGPRPDHKCGRLHGHNYTVVVSCDADDLDEHGFVVDFGDLEPIGAFIEETLDHRHLNDVLPFQPSSEMLARHLFDWCAANLAEPISSRLRAVRVSEKIGSTSAAYRPGTRPGPES
jgi:6-pyruvoyltetrahydropterin/6-carboxytetrahydropterin synthase